MGATESPASTGRVALSFGTTPWWVRWNIQPESRIVLFIIEEPGHIAWAERALTFDEFTDLVDPLGEQTPRAFRLVRSDMRALRGSSAHSGVELEPEVARLLCLPSRG
jgi:hypothetical protein